MYANVPSRLSLSYSDVSEFPPYAQSHCLPSGTELAQGYPETNAASAAFHRWVQGEQAMAKPHDPRHQAAFQEHPLVEELLAELQTIEDKEQVEGRFFTVMGWTSQNER